SSYPVNRRTVATEKTASAPTDEATISLQRSLYDPGYVNAMSHFYRGELGRIMVWRQRLDITTNWAITSSTAIITIAFANREVPLLPSFKISKLEAIGRRLKRNYVFIFILIMVAWVTKIFLHASEPITSGRALYHALRVGHIPSWLVAGTFIGTFVCVIAITIYVGKKSSGEITEFGAHRSLWRI